LSQLIVTSPETIDIGSSLVTTRIIGSQLFFFNLDDTAEPLTASVLMIDTSNQVTAGPPIPTPQVQYSNGFMATEQLVTDTPRQFFIAYGDASTVTGTGWSNILKQFMIVLKLFWQELLMKSPRHNLRGQQHEVVV
jgi:hypothetical protein